MLPAARHQQALAEWGAEVKRLEGELGTGMFKDTERTPCKVAGAFMLQELRGELEALGYDGGERLR